MKKFVFAVLFLVCSAIVFAQKPSTSKAYQHLEQVIGLLADIKNFQKFHGRQVPSSLRVQLFTYNNPAIHTVLVSEQMVGRDENGGFFLEYIKPQYTKEFINAVTKEYPRNEPGATFVRAQAKDRSFTVYTLMYEGLQVLDVVDYHGKNQKDAVNMFLMGL